MEQKISITKAVNKNNYVIDNLTNTVRAIVTDEVGLEKPLSSDYYNIEIHNSNMEKIDTYLRNFKTLNANQCYETTITEDMWEVSEDVFGVEITHNLETKKLYVSVLDSNTFECIFTGYAPVTENKIYLKNETRLNCLVMILTANNKSTNTSATIDDTVTSTQRTWSSNKIAKEIEKKTVDLSHLATKEELASISNTVNSLSEELNGQRLRGIEIANSLLEKL